MMTRTTDKTVAFGRSFALSNYAEPFPPGEYLLHTDEEMIGPLPFPAWRRVTTTLHVHRDGTTQIVTVDPRELDLLLARDTERAS